MTTFMVGNNAPVMLAHNERAQGSKLNAGERKQLKISFEIVEAQGKAAVGKRVRSPAEDVAHGIDLASHDWLSAYAEVHSNSIQLNRVMQRSLLDLGILKSELDGHHYALIVDLVEDVLEAGSDPLPVRAAMGPGWERVSEGMVETEQGPLLLVNVVNFVDRTNVGVAALQMNEIPQTPYYGAVDSTPLFLILVGEHANWTGDLSLFNDIRQHVERALDWVDHGGADPNGKYLSYASKSSKGLGNQGWKDSGDSVMNSDGSLATPPIALVEVQGYVYRAKLLMADLYARAGDSGTGDRLRSQAAELKKAFNRDFWVESKNFFAIALQKDHKPAAVISSNPGQALWTGIVDDNKAEAVMRHLDSDEMFSGWGIRTLSHKERRYNPIGYHLGTVWPHDNSIIAAGFRRYGFDKQAVQVLESIVSAGQHFEHARLPEVFGGFSQRDFAVPVRYPVACHPQAWAAGSVPFMISSLVGLKADAFNQRLRVIRPVLPGFVNELYFRRIKIGDSTVDLHFKRSMNRDVEARVVHHSGSIKVEVEQERKQLDAA